MSPTCSVPFWLRCTQKPIGLDSGETEALLELAKPEFATSTMLTQVVPHPDQSDTKLQSGNRTLMAKYRDKPPSNLTLEGLMAAKGLVRAIESAGRDLSHPAIPAALAGEKRVDLGGMTLIYSRQDYRGSSFVDIALLLGNGRLVQKFPSARSIRISSSIQQLAPLTGKTSNRNTFALIFNPMHEPPSADFGMHALNLFDGYLAAPL